MDGRLLVLCDERPTVDDYGNRIDENRNLLRPTEDGKYVNMELEEVEVDENKRVVNAMDLLLPVEPNSIQDYDIIYAAWETVAPSDIEPLRQMKSYSQNQEQIPFDLILKSDHKSSIMRKVYAETLTGISRPRLDFSFIASDKFMQTFVDAMQRNGIVSILPAFSKSDSQDIINSRVTILNSLRTYVDMRVTQNRGEHIEILPGMIYEEFGEVYGKAKEEMMKILSKPFFNEAPKTSPAPKIPDDDEGR